MLKEARGLVFIFCCISLVFFTLSFFLNKIFNVFSAIFAVVTLLLIYFFRDPLRDIKINKNVLYSPADGRIFDITENENFYCVRIFMSIFDVHVQRAPVSGVIKRIEYKKGKFSLAHKTEAGFINERNLIEIYIPEVNVTVKITQVAGAIARRIVCWVKEDFAVRQGQKIGAILLGSQVSFEFPKIYKLLVTKNQKVFAGISAVAVLSKPE
ncbi:MAG: phosphatidylserine decarboxylase [Endomicrobiia bacterium]